MDPVLRRRHGPGGRRRGRFRRAYHRFRGGGAEQGPLVEPASAVPSSNRSSAGGAGPEAAPDDAAVAIEGGVEVAVAEERGASLIQEPLGGLEGPAAANAEQGVGR